MGIAALESLTNSPFDSMTYNAVPQLIYMDSADKKDSLRYLDGWDERDAELVDKLFGEDPVSRRDESESIYQAAGANVQFLLVDGVAHDRMELQQYSTEFFKKVLHGE